MSVEKYPRTSQDKKFGVETLLKSRCLLVIKERRGSIEEEVVDSAHEFLFVGFQWKHPEGVDLGVPGGNGRRAVWPYNQLEWLARCLLPRAKKARSEGCECQGTIGS